MPSAACCRSANRCGRSALAKCRSAAALFSRRCVIRRGPGLVRPRLPRRQRHPHARYGQVGRGPTPFGPAVSTRSNCSGWGRPRSCSTSRRRSPARGRSRIPTRTSPRSSAELSSTPIAGVGPLGQPAAQRQAGAVPAPLAGSQRSGRVGHSVLDLDPKQLWGV